jgi:hypothetical protein
MSAITQSIAAWKTWASRMAPLTSQKQIAGLAGWLIASFIAAATGALLVPYLLWVSFAAALNYSVWQLNPQVLG